MNTQEALKILELSPGASKEDIQAAFRKAAKVHHPDRNKDDPNAETKFKEMNSAYQYLNNPQNYTIHSRLMYTTNYQN